MTGVAEPTPPATAAGPISAPAAAPPRATPPPVEPVLRVEHLSVSYHTDAGRVRAVDNVSFDLPPGVRMGLVGESGSGKTTVANALMRLIKPPGRIDGGRIVVDGVETLPLSNEQMRQVRMRKIALIPQGAMSALNPVMRVRDQILDGLLIHEPRTPRRELERRVENVLVAVELDPRVARRYPHELSGGMKQRVCIAIAVAMRPQVIIADEPTSALDVVVQRQVMETIGRLQRDLHSSIVLIGHDMGLMAQFVDRLAVMYAGRLVEVGPIREIFREPLHPYTQLLISSLPVLGKRGVFRGIPGVPPSLLAVPPGCVFHPRCPQVMAQCPQQIPPLVQVAPNRWVACHLHEAAL
ncbi:MAG: ABC transporter ATP-binding protein [Chloroflexi bacterium]|nr:ABC transporter ATP-binding protein [Chloroflexota bacterium]